MGGVPHAKVPTNAERNASMLAAKKGDADYRELAAQKAYIKRSRRRSSYFGGPESGTQLGAPPTTLGVNS